MARLTLVLAVMIAVSAMLSTWDLAVSRYTIAATQIEVPIRIVQLTDLHNSEFGDGNSRLIRKVADQEPDLILIAPQIMKRRREETIYV